MFTTNTTLSANNNDAIWDAECTKWRGEILTGKWRHYCNEWDGLPVDETTGEFCCCRCWIIADNGDELRRPTTK